MFSRLRHHIDSAHVIAMIALFVALAGSAYATGLLPKNSVGRKQLKRGAVTPPKLSKGTVAMLQGARGPAGPKGAKGTKGARGAPGDKGATGPIGPSDVYAAGDAFGAMSGSFAQVAAITVPAGDYLLQAKTTIFSTTASSVAIASCLIAPTAAGGPGTWDETRVSLPAIPSEVSSQALALAGVGSFSSPQSVVLSCRTELGATSFDDARVWAVKVGAVHGAPLPID